METLPQNAVLLIIDVQKGFDELSWGQRNNPDAEANIARLLAAWRQTNRPVFHVQHLSLMPNSPLRATQPGSAIKDAVKPQGDELLFQKHVNSAFIGTDLEERLREHGYQTLVIAGLTTPHCVSTTTRMAGNLGFRTYVVSDATAAFALIGHDGQHYTAAEIHAVSLATLNGEFATVVETEGLLSAMHERGDDELLDGELLKSGDIAAAYDQWSHIYETNENATRDLAAHILRQQLDNLHHRDVLEIGCGTGLNTRYLAEQSRSVHAVDFSTGMLEQARANVTAVNVRFKQQDIRLGWHIVDDSVDLVVCMLVLEHIEELHHIFGEAARVLRPGGEFFLCELHPFRQLQGRQARFTNKDSGQIILVPAYLHDLSDYLNAGLQHDFEFLSINEWRDGDGSAKVTIPRLFSMRAIWSQ